jgi:hypothetical protein
MELIGEHRGHLPDVFRDIKESDLAEVDKLARAFEWVTSRMLEHGNVEIEIAHAMDDKDALVKVQMRLEVVKSVRVIFQDCYRFMLGKKAWED